MKPSGKAPEELAHLLGYKGDGLEGLRDKYGDGLEAFLEKALPRCERNGSLLSLP